jgi:26S proteasome regulatory subunit N10
VFTCSQIADEEKSLVTLARRMKKNAISIDFIAFGDLESETKSKLEAFNEHVKGGDGSHLVFVPPGPNHLSDVLLTSPILAGEGAGGAGSGGVAAGENGVPGGADGATAGGGAAAAAGGTGFEFGIDPSLDPELAMALRMSMEEETNRLERQRREREEAEQKEKEKQDKEKERLEGIPEEGQVQGGQPSGVGAAAGDESSGQGGEEMTKNAPDEGDRKDGQDGGGGEGGGGGSADKMDTA